MASERSRIERGERINHSGARVRLEDYANDWLATRVTPSGKTLRPRTVDLYRGLLDNHIFPTLGAHQVGKLDPATIRRWHRGLLDAEVGPGAVAKAYKLLRTILNQAVDDRLIGVNPCKIPGAGIESAEERPTASVEQVERLAELAGARYRTMVLLAAWCGLRLGELVGLQRRHIDTKARTVRVEQQRQQLANGTYVLGPPKTAAGVRTVAVPASVAKELAEHLLAFAEPGRDGFVFTGEQGRPLDRVWWGKRWRRIAAQARMEGFRFHDLRHTGNTLAAQAGANQADLMARLGHASPDAARRYLHATADRDQALADALDARRGSSVEERTQTKRN